MYSFIRFPKANPPLCFVEAKHITLYFSADFDDMLDRVEISYMISVCRVIRYRTAADRFHFSTLYFLKAFGQMLRELGFEVIHGLSVAPVFLHLLKPSKAAASAVIHLDLAARCT